jgi:hypothetical protein
LITVSELEKTVTLTVIQMFSDLLVKLHTCMSTGSQKRPRNGGCGFGDGG